MSKKVADRVKSFGRSILVELRQRAMRSKDLVSLAVGDPDFSTPKYIREIAKSAIDEGYTHYTDSTGLQELREAIAEKLKSENSIEVDPDSEVIVTTGAQEAMYVTIQAFVNPGEEVIVPNPCFAYDKVVQLARGIPISVYRREELGFRVDPGEIEEKVTPRTKAIVVITPDNPTGAVYGKSDLEAVAEIAKRHDLLVVSDEIYEKIIFDGRKHHSIASLPGMEERTITINGFSKGYAMTGWRIGYLAADETLTSNIKKVHYYAVVAASTIAQRAALAALKAQDRIREEQEKMIEEYQRRRDLLVDSLNNIPGMRCLKPEGSIFAFPNVKAFGMSSLDFVNYLIEEGKVLVYPGTAFGDGGEGYLRISLAYSQDKIKDALNRMEEATRKLPIKGSV